VNMPWVSGLTECEKVKSAIHDEGVATTSA